MPAVIDEHTQWIDPTTSVPLASGKIYIGTAGADPKTNTITIYSDQDLTTTIANPQTLDSSGRATNKIWIPGAYSLQVDNSADVQKYQELECGGNRSGTFTPTIQDGDFSDSESQTYSLQLGVYQRINDIVFFTLEVNCTSIGTLSGAVYVAGLPFTSANDSVPAPCSVGDLSTLSIVTGAAVYAQVEPNTTRVSLHYADTTGGNTNMVFGEFQNGSQVNLAGWYIAA